jgi:hypothetical protein
MAGRRVGCQAGRLGLLAGVCVCVCVCVCLMQRALVA